MKSSSRLDVLIAGALTLGSALPRVPYLTLIPVLGDYVLQTVYALSIQPGKFMPLVGNDPYAGALFSYIIAAWLRVFGATPDGPFIVMLIMGMLTVGLTYLLARGLGLGRTWAVLAGLLVAANPHHILLNSHAPGTVYAIPLFSTASLVALALAVRRESGRWLVAAGALMGLAMQTNPIPILMAPGVGVWFLIQKKSSIGLRTRWPYLATAAFVLAYSPVIVYNVQNSLFAFQWARTRDYLWEFNPSPLAFAHNLGRLFLQLCWQVSGVLEGPEDVQTLLGLPLLYSIWAIAGLVYAARRGISLPMLALASQMLTMPLWSSHYGMIVQTRLTAPLTPLIMIAMSRLAAGVWARVRSRTYRPGTALAIAGMMGILLVTLGLWPLTFLCRYYERQVAAGETNAHYYAFFEEFKRQWHGEKILIGGSLLVFDASEYFLALGHIPYEVVPLDRIQERVATGQESGRITLVLDDNDMTRVKLRANLVAWRSPAAEAMHRKQGSRWYTIERAQDVKPSFVLDADAPLPPTTRAVQVSFADQLRLIGWEPRSSRVNSGDEFALDFYWQAERAMPADYTMFIHLTGPDGRLVVQTDQPLGRGFYFTHYWQPGEVIHEKYVLTLPQDMAGGDYTLIVGVYDFPSLERLKARASSLPVQDQAITLGAIHVGP